MSIIQVPAELMPVLSDRVRDQLDTAGEGIKIYNDPHEDRLPENIRYAERAIAAWHAFNQATDTLPEEHVRFAIEAELRDINSRFAEGDRMSIDDAEEFIRTARRLQAIIGEAVVA